MRDEPVYGPTGAPSGVSAARSGMVLFSGKASTSIIGGVATLVIIGFLEPPEFGAAAAALLVVGAVQAALNFGLDSAVLALGPSASRDRTALTLAAASGLVLGIIVFLTAPITMGLLGQPGATDVLRALTPLLVLGHWAAVRNALIEREFRYGRVAVVSVVASLVGFGVGLTGAVKGWGAWAVVWQALTTETTRAAGLAILRDGARTFGWHAQGVRDLWEYGRKLIFNSVYVFIYNNFDDAVVSRLGGAGPLGLYRFAYRVANLPTQMFTHTSQRLMLPLLSSLRRKRQTASRYYLGQLRVLSLVVGLLMFGLLIHGDVVLAQFYGRTWTGAIPTLRILSIYGLFRSVGATTGAVFLSAGRPELVAKIAKWQTLVMVAAVVPSFQVGGLEGAALATTVPLVVATLVAVGIASPMTATSRRSAMLAIGMGWGAALAANGLGWLARRSIDGWSSLFVGGLVTLLSFAVVAFIFFRAEVRLVRAAASAGDVPSGQGSA